MPSRLASSAESTWSAASCECGAHGVLQPMPPAARAVVVLPVVAVVVLPMPVAVVCPVPVVVVPVVVRPVLRVVVLNAHRSIVAAFRLDHEVAPAHPGVSRPQS